ncbi:hypothetical protein HYQ46_001993 [Verticillium longisporum]|nr:hypothetical protein HYQ46_001993 [Verticillium longisporum]
MSRVCITIRFACRDASRHGGSLSQSVQDPFTLHTKLKEQSFGLVACSDDGGTAGQRRGWLLMYKVFLSRSFSCLKRNYHSISTAEKWTSYEQSAYERLRGNS